MGARSSEFREFKEFRGRYLISNSYLVANADYSLLNLHYSPYTPYATAHINQHHKISYQKVVDVIYLKRISPGIVQIVHPMVVSF
jgi:hypothetical protein